MEGPIQLSNATFFLHSSCSYWPHQRGLNSQGTFLNIPLCSSRLAELLWAHCFLPDLRNRLWKKDTVFLNYWRCSNCSAGLENGEQKIKESANLLRKKKKKAGAEEYQMPQRKNKNVLLEQWLQVHQLFPKDYYYRVEYNFPIIRTSSCSHRDFFFF